MELASYCRRNCGVADVCGVAGGLDGSDTNKLRRFSVLENISDFPNDLRGGLDMVPDAI